MEGGYTLPRPPCGPCRFPQPHSVTLRMSGLVPSLPGPLLSHPGSTLSPRLTFLPDPPVGGAVCSIPPPPPPMLGPADPFPSPTGSVMPTSSWRPPAPPGGRSPHRKKPRLEKGRGLLGLQPGRGGARAEAWAETGAGVGAGGQPWSQSPTPIRPLPVQLPSRFQVRRLTCKVRGPGEGRCSSEADGGQQRSRRHCPP